MRLNNLVIISDTHVGCKLGLMHPDGAKQDDGGPAMPSHFQRELWRMWCEFHDEWVPEVTHGEPYALIHNGDAIDGVHHNSVTQWTHDLEDQVDHAAFILRPYVDRAAEYYHIRGTEAHVGKSGQQERRLAELLGAIPNAEGQHARWDLRIRCGAALVHLSHHIGTTGSSAYESTAVYKELVEAYVEAGRWGDEPPDVVVRSHRHRAFETRIPTTRGNGIAAVTPAWQGKTPFAYRIAGARQSQPQFGGLVVRYHDGEVFVRHKVWRLEPSTIEGDDDNSRAMDGGAGAAVPRGGKQERPHGVGDRKHVARKQAAGKPDRAASAKRRKDAAGGGHSRADRRSHAKDCGLSSGGDKR